jgi:hypothetical protein
LELKKHFGERLQKKERKVLMPFFWNEVVGMGQIHGNRNLGAMLI